MKNKAVLESKEKFKEMVQEMKKSGSWEEGKNKLKKIINEAGERGEEIKKRFEEKSNNLRVVAMEVSTVGKIHAVLFLFGTLDPV